MSSQSDTGQSRALSAVPQTPRSIDRRAIYEEKGRKHITALIVVALAGFVVLLGRALWGNHDWALPTSFLLAATAGISSMAAP